MDVAVELKVLVVVAVAANNRRINASRTCLVEQCNGTQEWSPPAVGAKTVS